MDITCGDHPYEAFWTNYWSLFVIQLPFSGTKKPDLGLFVASKRLDLIIKWPFGSSKGGPKLQLWISDAYPVNIGHLDHYVVFGTQSGLLQDFQKGKQCHMGVKQNPLDPPLTPLDPPRPPQKPPKPFKDPPYKQSNPSRYLVTHQHSQKSPKSPLKPKSQKRHKNPKTGQKDKK